MSEASNLCLSCGICCDGTLIGFVQLESNEVSRIRDVMDIEESNNEGVFLHPCDKFCDRCTIYSQRPKQCASFECKLMNSVADKELTFNTAVNTIALVKEKKDDIEKQLISLQIHQKSTSFYFKMLELKKQLQKSELISPLSTDQQVLLQDINQLDEILANYFGVSYD